MAQVHIAKVPSSMPFNLSWRIETDIKNTSRITTSLLGALMGTHPGLSPDRQTVDMQNEKLDALTDLNLTGPVSLPAHDDSGAESELVQIRLFIRIWSQLPISKTTAEDFDHVAKVIKSYSDSFEALQRVRTEALRFLDSVCSAHVRVSDASARRPDKVKGAAKTEVKQLAKLVRITPIATSPSLDAELLGEPVEFAFELLQSSLQVATRKVAGSFLDSIEKLYQNGVVGAIEFPVEGACRFRFFETHVHEECADTTVETSQTRRVRRTTTTHKGRVDLSHRGHEHHLAFATRHSLPAYQELIPRRVRSLLEHVPAWLQPEIEIVDGDLFRVDTRQRHKRTVEWSEQHVKETRIHYHQDPAATLGTYVLGAWNCDEADLELREIALTQQRHTTALADQRRVDALEGWQQLKLAGLLQLIPLAIHGIAFAWAGSLHSLAALVSLALLAQLVPALRQFALAGDIKADATYYVLSFVVAVSGLLAVHAGIFMAATGSLPGLAGLVLALVAAAWFGSEWQKHYHLPTI